MIKSKDEEHKLSKMSEIDLNILIKFIGTFDGSRDKLTPFINNCRNAISLASPSQTDILLKYILSRLEGKAETACAVKEFSKWNQLEDFLKAQFGDIKHYAYLLSDLQECKQGRNETVSQYSLRVESCLAKLLTEINISIPTRKKDELAGRVAAMQDLALNVFTIGLQPHLSMIIRCRDPSTLNEAINLATAEEKIVGISVKYAGQSNFSSSEQRRQNASFSRPTFNFNNQSSRPNHNPFCRYCKTLGHSIEYCKKREYNNSRKFNYAQNANRSPQVSNFNRRNQPINVVNQNLQRSENENVYNLNDQAFPSSIVRED